MSVTLIWRDRAVVAASRYKLKYDTDNPLHQNRNANELIKAAYAASVAVLGVRLMEPNPRFPNHIKMQLTLDPKHVPNAAVASDVVTLVDAKVSKVKAVGVGIEYSVVVYS